jgi:hypothetical protein
MFENKVGLTTLAQRDVPADMKLVLLRAAEAMKQSSRQ